jgi:hypothetical protein
MSPPAPGLPTRPGQLRAFRLDLVNSGHTPEPQQHPAASAAPLHSSTAQLHCTALHQPEPRHTDTSRSMPWAANVPWPPASTTRVPGTAQDKESRARGRRSAPPHAASTGSAQHSTAQHSKPQHMPPAATRCPPLAPCQHSRLLPAPGRRQLGACAVQLVHHQVGALPQAQLGAGAGACSGVRRAPVSTLPARDRDARGPAAAPSPPTPAHQAQRSLSCQRPGRCAARCAQPRPHARTHALAGVAHERPVQALEACGAGGGPAACRATSAGGTRARARARASAPRLQACLQLYVGGPAPGPPACLHLRCTGP